MAAPTCRSLRESEARSTRRACGRAKSRDAGFTAPRGCRSRSMVKCAVWPWSYAREPLRSRRTVRWRVEFMGDLAMHQAPKRKAPGSREAPGARRTSIHLRRHCSEIPERVKKNVLLVFSPRAPIWGSCSTLPASLEMRLLARQDPLGHLQSRADMLGTLRIEGLARRDQELTPVSDTLDLIARIGCRRSVSI